MLCTCCRYSAWGATPGTKALDACRRCAQGCTNAGCHTLRPNPNGVYGRFQRINSTWHRLWGRLGRGPGVES